MVFIGTTRPGFVHLRFNARSDLSCPVRWLKIVVEPKITFKISVTKLVIFHFFHQSLVRLTENINPSNNNINFLQLRRCVPNLFSNNWHRTSMIAWANWAWTVMWKFSNNWNLLLVSIPCSQMKNMRITYKDEEKPNTKSIAINNKWFFLSILINLICIIWKIIYKTLHFGCLSKERRNIHKNFNRFITDVLLLTYTQRTHIPHLLFA